ncbi:hypothetical protein SDC9_109590 [bioreactor metagenome]|uniref:Imm-5-like domain-containing protein n=1 Tax=bioreactor metagenome TaxID=1076179 RepID=A0A645BHP1_9ZZZZ|nr:hypothetical protein [Erysipelotrichaceae bacterium]
MRKLRYDRNSACLQPLRLMIMEQNQRPLVAWVLDYIPFYLKIIENRHPQEKRPQIAVEKARN